MGPVTGSWSANIFVWSDLTRSATSSCVVGVGWTVEHPPRISKAARRPALAGTPGPEALRELVIAMVS
jgi:hypothetical protein